LVWGNAFLILDFGLDVFNGVWGLNLQSNGLASQSLDKNLHTSSQPEDQVKGGFLLDVVVGQCPSIFKLLTSKDQPLLVWGNAFLILDFGLDVFNGVWGLNLQSNGLASQSLDKNLHTSSQPEDQVKGGFLLDVVVGQCPTIFKLFSSKDQPLLIWGNAFLVLDLSLDIFNGVRGFNLKGDGLASQGLDKNLHTSPQSEDQVKGWFLLDVVVGQCPTIFKLFSSKDQPLLVWGNAFLVLDLGFDIFNSVWGLHFQSDGFASQGFDKNLHTSPQSEDQVKGW